MPRTPPSAPPTGELSFLFTDIEGSTRLLDHLGDDYPPLLEAHRRIIRAAVLANGGLERSTGGDSFFVVFESASDAVYAATEAQRALARHPWPAGGEILVRMGIGTGDAQLVDDDYVGMAIHRAARVAGAAHGGQVLVSESTRRVADGADGIGFVDLGEHVVKDFAQPERIYQVSHPELRASFPAPRSLAGRRDNLPADASPFVGRDSERRRLAELLAGSRLVTLVGPGGAGKTRLALAAARDALGEFADGVYLAELASLSSGHLVAGTVAAALGLAEQPGREPAEVIAGYVGERQLLFVLDNCEHVVAECRDLVDHLLRACPALVVLATSREALGAQSETRWPVPPLGLPDGDDVATVAGSDAARLFLDRARRFDPEYVLAPEDAPVLRRLCSQLDGLPLAIELSAARLRSLTLPEIATRLEDRFKLLAGGHAAAERHRTLLATVEWSHDLLSAAERQLFRRLSVFAGAFPLEAVEAVSDDTAGDVLDVLTKLIDKSMVMPESRIGGTSYYRLLESLRAYGRARLDDAAEREHAENARLSWLVDMASAAEAGLLGADDLVWLARFDRSLDDVRAAAAWGETRRPREVLALVGDLWAYWWTRGMLSEGCALVQSALAADDGSSAQASARGHATASFLSYCQGENESLERHATAALVLAPEGYDPVFAWSTGWALLDLGELAQQAGDLVRTRAHFERALVVGSEGRHSYVVARAEQQLAYLCDAEGDDEKSLLHAGEGLRMMRRLGNKVGISRLLYALGRILWGQGRADEAREAYEESLALSVEAGDKLGIRGAYQGLGTLAYERGDLLTGRKDYESLLATTDALGQPPRYRASELRDLAATATAHGDGAAAEEWLTAAVNYESECR